MQIVDLQLSKQSRNSKAGVLLTSSFAS